MKNMTNLAGRRAIFVAGALGAAAFASLAYAATFGSQLSVGNVKVKQIWSGRYGPTFLTFEPSTLTGCHNANGGYLSSTWPEGMADLPNEPDISSRQLATLMLAKATGASISIYYRVNSTGTGWDKCAIDSIWME